MSTITLRPGIMVALSSSVSGGVSYTTKPLNADEVANANNVPIESEVKRWETVKVTEDPVEHAAAVKVRSKCRSLITSPCISSAFGLLCPKSREEELDKAIAESKALAAAWNAGAKTTRVDVWILKGIIVQNDDDAVRAIGSEIKNLLDEMKAGVTALDVGKIREAANKARQLGSMLDAESEGKVSAAIKEARDNAKMIVKRLGVDGALVADVAKEIVIKDLDSARFAFLDLDAPKAIEGEVLSPVEARGLDLEPECAPTPAAESTRGPDLDADLPGETDDNNGNGGDVEMAASSYDGRALDL